MCLLRKTGTQIGVLGKSILRGAMNINLPEKVARILAVLTEAGYEGYAVGGCVRDTILGKIPQDWDITTSAKPVEIKKLFSKTIDTGIAHGTVTVLLDKEGFEVTTFRIDGIYEDSRHPKEVVFTPNLLEDLKRRDFTINAMAYNEKIGLVDAFGGIKDLEHKIIRCVGEARERFKEDALRMMRAVRFGAQLGFEIEKNTKDAILELSKNLSNISAERIQVELVKLVTSPHPENISVLYETGITAAILPEFDRMMETEQHNPHHIYNVGEHVMKSVCEVNPDKVLCLTMLFHDVAKPICKTTDQDGRDHFYGHEAKGSDIAKKILRRLKFDNDTIEKVSRLVACHDDNPPISPKSIRRAIVRHGIEQYPRIFDVKRADILAQSQYKREEKLSYLEEYEACYLRIMEENQCLMIKDLAVSGKDLIEEGMLPGKRIGEALKELLELVLEEPDKNSKGVLLSHLRERKYF